MSCDVSVIIILCRGAEHACAHVWDCVAVTSQRGTVLTGCTFF